MYSERRDEVFEIIKQLIIDHGYTVTYTEESLVECHNEDTNIDFSQMKEDENYIEATLNITTDEGIAIYDIFTGEYSVEFFGEQSKSNVFLKEETILLTSEVERLSLSAYVEAFSL